MPNEIRNAVGKEFGQYVITTWVRDAVMKLWALMKSFDEHHVFFGDGFAEAMSLLTNWGDFNWRNVPVRTIQLGNPTDSWGCSVQKCMPIMEMGAVGFALAEHEGHTDEFVVGMYTVRADGHKSPLGADLYCTSARILPKHLVWCGKEFEVKMAGEIVHHGNPIPGKSAAVRQVAGELGLPVVDINIECTHVKKFDFER